MITISEKSEVETRKNKILLDGQVIGSLEYNSSKKDSYCATLAIPQSTHGHFYIIGYGSTANEAILAAVEKSIKEAKTIYDNVNELARRVCDIGAISS
jgi:hypothetical protein